MTNKITNTHGTKGIIEHLVEVQHSLFMNTTVDGKKVSWYEHSLGRIRTITETGSIIIDTDGSCMYEQDNVVAMLSCSNGNIHYNNFSFKKTVAVQVL